MGEFLILAAFPSFRDKTRRLHAFMIILSLVDTASIDHHNQVLVHQYYQGVFINFIGFDGIM